ncbi:MAG: endonuclease/exonuclease/phosphatase family protein [Candidatus Hodarchaeota archaeon]
MAKEKPFFWTLGLFTEIWLGYMCWSLIIELISSVYFLNLATLSINASISFLGVFFAPLVLGNRSIRQKVFENLAMIQGVMIVGVTGYFIPDAFFRAVFLSIGVACSILSFCSMWLISEERRERALWGFLLGLIVLLLLRWAFFSRNPLWFSWEFNIFSILILLCSIVFLYNEKSPIDYEGESHSSICIFSSLGFGSVLFLTHWLFSGYGVIPRWVSMSPFPWGALVILGLGLGLFFTSSSWTEGNIWGMIGFLGAVLLAYGNEFWGFLGGLLLGLVLPPLWFLITKEIVKRPPGRTLFFGSLVYLILLFGSVFTVTYDYVPGGWLFRESEEPLLLLSILFMILATKTPFHGIPSFHFILPRRAVLIAFGIIILVGMVGATTFRISLDQLRSYPEPLALSVMSYNIQQGFDVDGNVNFNEISKVIRSANVSIIGLQETDTLRVSSANRDVVEWLAEDLDMYSYAGPETRDSTFGNALLSTYNIQSTRAIILSSEGELAILLVTKIKVNNEDINILVAHFGENEEDRSAQADETAEIIQSLTGAIILLGDFNSEPNSTQIQTILDTGMNDSYVDANNGQHVPTTRQTDKVTIDFVFYRGLTVLSADVIDESDASDHNPVIATFLI